LKPGAELLIATRSAGKLKELGPLLAPLGATLHTLSDAGIRQDSEEEVLERFDTFEENALSKARYFYARSGIATVSDDSGLEVLALGARPGVHSKRWSGVSSPDDEELYELNRGKLLREMQGIGDRRARFVCVAAFVDGVKELVVRGETTGTILHAARGSGGFGYDPLFLSDDLGETLAECEAAVKESVSHRGRAFTELVKALRATGEREL
jgi:XTP/dITP diphosphohydrolase